MEKDTHSVIINIPKQRTLSKRVQTFSSKQLKLIMAKEKTYRTIRKPSQDAVKICTLYENIPLPVRQLKNDTTLLSYKHYSKRQDYIRNTKKLSISLNDKYKIICSDFQRRLFINKFPDEVKSILDVDKDFYNCVNGRHLKHDMDYKSLKIYLNHNIRIKQQIGYIKDCTLNIDVNQKKELEVYEKSLREVSNQVKCFDQFISEDYQKSMALLEKGTNLVLEVNKIKSELECLAGKKFTITSKLIGLDFKYGVQQKYGRFLYYLSPPLWRAKNRDFARSIEIEAKGFDLGVSSDEDTFAVIYEKIKKECSTDFIKPALYFTEPKHLMDVFETIEKHQLHYFTHVSRISPNTKILHDNIASFKEIINEDTVIVSGAIKDLQNLLELTEQRCEYLEKNFFNILYGLFSESVGSVDVLKNLLHLEFCYEQVFGEKPMNKDIKVIAQALEMFYMDYSKKFDALHNDRIRGAIKVCMETEKKKAKDALEAAKELRLYYRLERELLRAHGLPLSDNLYSPVQRITRKKLTKRLDNKRATLEDDQSEHSNFFTDLHEDANHSVIGFKSK